MKHGTELVKTLQAYLNSSCTVDTTAQVLRIHRNTLRYRLNRISTLTGCDLRDPDQRFQLDLACRAQTVLEAL